MKINLDENTQCEARVVAVTAGLRAGQIKPEVDVSYGLYKPESLEVSSSVLPGEYGLYNWVNDSTVKFHDILKCYFDNKKEPSGKLHTVGRQFVELKDVFEEVFDETLRILSKHPDYTLCTIHRPSYIFNSAFKPVQFGKRKKDAYFSIDDSGSLKYKNRNVTLVRKPEEKDIKSYNGEIYWYPSSSTIQNRLCSTGETYTIPLQFVFVTDAFEATEVYYKRQVDVDEGRVNKIKKEMTKVIAELARKQEEYREALNKTNLTKEIFNEVIGSNN